MSAAPITAEAFYLAALACRAESDRSDIGAACKLLRDLAAHLDAEEETLDSIVAVLNRYVNREIEYPIDADARLYVRALYLEAIEGLQSMCAEAA